MFDANKVQEVIGHAKRHDLEHLVGRIRELDAALHGLAKSTELPELMAIILPGKPPHFPGWTTPAEYAFALGLVGTCMSLVTHVAGTKSALLNWGRLVNVAAPER